MKFNINFLEIYLCKYFVVVDLLAIVFLASVTHLTLRYWDRISVCLSVSLSVCNKFPKFHHFP